MSDEYPWYRQPETFVAVAALVVSLSAVVVGIYEASLQRAHDRAEVWPHLEVSTWISDSGAKVVLNNTGLGPAIVRYVSVTVDGQPVRDWKMALAQLYGHYPPRFSSSTIFQHAVRPGDQSLLIGLSSKDLPPDFYGWAGRISIRICYSSVFNEYWMVTGIPGQSDKWEVMRACPAEPSTVDL